MRSRVFRFLAVPLFLGAVLQGCGSDIGEPNEREERLEAAQTWMYQLANLDDRAALESLAASEYPLLVIEPGHNFRPCSDDFEPEVFGIPAENRDDACADRWDTEEILEELRWTPAGTERLILAYIDVGQAEWYRDYWVEGWAAPEAERPGAPSFILAADPDDWLGNFVVAYWRDEWKELWLDGDQGIIAELARFGFDGVYLDWVEAYDDELAAEAAEAEDLDAAEEMMLFVEEIRAAGREVTPDFLVVAQNATFLFDDVPDPARYAAAIDALAVEDTWFYGNGSTEEWDAGDGDLWSYDVSDRLACEAAECSEAIEPPDNVCPDEEESQSCYESMPLSGDLHGGARHGCPGGTEGTSECWSTENRLAAYERYLDRGVPVFTVDYCISSETAELAYHESRSRGLRPLVTRVQLSRNTDTPPWEFE